MTMRLNPWGSHALTAAVLSLWFAPSASSQVRAVSLEELSASSTAIVLGKTQETRSYWNESRSQILTDITVRVDDALKGGAATETIITVPGGRVGNTIYEVSDQPYFVDGEEILVFLWEHPSGKMLVNGGPQGKLEVVEHPNTGKKMLRGLPQAGPGDVALSKTGNVLVPDAASGAASLDAVVAQIKTYVQNE